MKAYWYDNLPGDPRAPHDSGRPASPTTLQHLGILYQHCTSIADVDALAAARSYRNRDEITVAPHALGAAYEEKIEGFFREHLHEDEEIRYILGGAGYFDVRNEGDEWVRIRLEVGDLIVMPAGIYHRFTTDEQNVEFTNAMRLFKEDPKWTPLDRGEETEKNRYRQEYLKTRHTLAA
ncbi:ard ard family [Paraphaeosphaeria minitans]|uniref:Acireductone dioxygenase n=1 Tax=Paraphaeosphaeria minitans TaxID=565426 RepID=A0A9P6GE70_9PLEO|nr:ard ard family [Paraphaeosphaeria minitans]